MKLEKYKLRFLKWINRVKSGGFVKHKTFFSKLDPYRAFLKCLAKAQGLERIFSSEDLYANKPVIKDDSKNDLSKYEYAKSQWKNCDKIP